MSMSGSAPEITRVLFWSLAIGILFLPKRWALLAYLVIIQVDVSGPGWASPSAVGLENAIKVGLLPLILLLRTCSFSLIRQWTRPLQLWLLFTCYVAIAALWSPYHLSALKMVVYLVGYALVFLLFTQAWKQGLLDLAQIVAALWLSLLLAGVQTYLMGNAFGSPPKLIIEQARFTTFAPPQSYAAFLLCCGVLLLFGKRGTSMPFQRLVLTLSGGGVLVGLLLVGSRYVAIGAMGLLGVALIARFEPQWSRATLRPLALLKPLGLVLTTSVILIGGAAVVAPHNRIFALRGLVANGRFNPDAIGTFEWRLEAYRTALDRIESRGLLANVFGSGTSSGADVILEFNPTAFPANTIDPNRSLHDEFLRSFYEWGVIGTALFLAFLASVVIGVARQTQRYGWHTTWAFWGLFPTLMLGLLLENVLAGSGTPVGTGFALVFAYVAVAPVLIAEETEGEVARAHGAQLLPATGR
jgi:hypothetical protein